jgi:hypothetical protein
MGLYVIYGTYMDHGIILDIWDIYRNVVKKLLDIM